MPYVGGKREKASLKFEKDVYTPEGVGSISDRELRKEYSRLRSIARKRLERMQGTDFEDTQIYKLNVGKYKPIKQLEPRELRRLFVDVAKFVMSDRGSLKGLEQERAKIIATMHERGYAWVNEKNYRKFADFLEFSRIANLSRIIDSERLAQFYEWAEKKKLSGEKFYTAFQSFVKRETSQRQRRNKEPKGSEEYRRHVKNTLDEIYPGKYNKKNGDST